MQTQQTQQGPSLTYIYIYTYIKNTNWDNNIMSVMYLCVKRITTIYL